MIDNEMCSTESAIIIPHPTSVSGIITVYCCIKNNQEILLEIALADFTRARQEDDLTLSRPREMANFFKSLTMNWETTCDIPFKRYFLGCAINHTNRDGGGHILE